MSKVVTYTAIIGNYDKLYEPYFKTPDTDLVCFTDNKNFVSDSWKIVMVDRMYDDPLKCAMYYKVLSHRLFPDAGMTVWVDGNLELLTTPDIGTVGMLLEKNPMAAYPHDSIKCVYKDAESCIENGIDDTEVIETQMGGYRENGFPENFWVTQTSFLVRKNVPMMTVFNEAWWREIERGSKIARLGFDYCRWELNVPMGWINGSVYDGTFFLERKHNITEKGCDQIST